MPDEPDEILPEKFLIGVDGGASAVRAHEIAVLPDATPNSSKPSLGLGAASASGLYQRARGFRPVPIASQLLALERGRVAVGGIEGAQARLYLEAASRAILEVASQAGKSRVRLGVCMPGLKTLDGRGIAVMRNGPRIPDYLDRLQAMLAERGIALAGAVGRLSSDGEAAAQGEDAHPEGQLRGIPCAWYLGGGTGLSEALKVDGTIRALDSLKGFVRKAWQMETEAGKNVEDLLSPRGMNAAWAAHSGGRPGLRPEDLPERRAVAGDGAAAALLLCAAEAFAGLAVDRMIALRGGFQGGPAARIPANTFLGRIVVGQRLGAILADAALRQVFRDPLEKVLARRIVATGDGALRKHYLDGQALREGLLVPSLLRAAPAIGAVALELRSTSELRAREEIPGSAS